MGGLKVVSEEITFTLRRAGRRRRQTRGQQGELCSRQQEQQGQGS